MSWLEVIKYIISILTTAVQIGIKIYGWIKKPIETNDKIDRQHIDEFIRLGKRIVLKNKEDVVKDEMDYLNIREAVQQRRYEIYRPAIEKELELGVKEIDHLMSLEVSGLGQRLRNALAENRPFLVAIFNDKVLSKTEKSIQIAKAII